MSNHYHLVLKLNPAQTKLWSDMEIAKRWQHIFKGPLLIQKYARQEALLPAEIETIKSILAVYSRRLGDLSWFMKCLNEPIARKANSEDGVTGHFWEARFSSQALLTDSALLTCMAYVDLNPIRAGIATIPEESPHTSICERRREEWPLHRTIIKVVEDQNLTGFDLPIKPLLAFRESNRTIGEECLPISFLDYTELVNWTGRSVVTDKRGAIRAHTESVLKRLNISKGQWLTNATRFESHHRLKSAMVSIKK
ncbi:MAG: transposase [Gammaproteobacteria bacterium]